MSRNKKFRLLAVIFLVAFVFYITNQVAVAGKTPLVLSWGISLPEKIIKDQKYDMIINWANTDTKKSYDGYLLFTATSNQPVISNKDVTLTYNGFIITPKALGNSLQFRLPQETFGASMSGTISLEVQPNNPGSYRWSIAILNGYGKSG